MKTTQRYPPSRCFDAETANNELTTVGPRVAATDCASSASPFAVPRDAEPGVWSRVRIMMMLFGARLVRSADLQGKQREHLRKRQTSEP